jgi:hypothetical protein
MSRAVVDGAAMPDVSPRAVGVVVADRDKTRFPLECDQLEKQLQNCLETTQWS